MSTVYILFGSQTGNAESIAKDAYEIIKEKIKESSGNYFYFPIISQF
jgi:flavodoxin